MRRTWIACACTATTETDSRGSSAGHAAASGTQRCSHVVALPHDATDVHVRVAVHQPQYGSAALTHAVHVWWRAQAAKGTRTAPEAVPTRTALPVTSSTSDDGTDASAYVCTTVAAAVALCGFITSLCSVPSVLTAHTTSTDGITVPKPAPERQTVSCREQGFDACSNTTASCHATNHSGGRLS